MDRALRRRMALALGGVLVVDLLVVGALAALLVPWLRPLGVALATALGIGGLATPLLWLAMTIPGLALFLAAQVRYTRRQLIADVGATPATEETYPDLLARVRRLAAQAGVPVPTVAVVDSEVPNSFTVGRLGSATLVVSEGLLATLSAEQLDAVLAHELAHLLNHDATVLTLSSFLPSLVADRSTLGLDRVDHTLTWGLALAIGFLLSAGLVDAPFFSGDHVGAFVGLVFVAVVLGGIVLGVGATLLLGVSHRLAHAREFAADRAGAQLSGNPAALATALEQLDADASDRAERDARRSDVTHLCLLPYGFDHADDPATDEFTVSTRSHPPTGERVRRLRALAADLETDGGRP